MSIVTITYEARCKHCKNCETFQRKTYCTKNIKGDKILKKVKQEGIRIRQNDKSCKDFQL